MNELVLSLIAGFFVLAMFIAAVPHSGQIFAGMHVKHDDLVRVHGDYLLHLLREIVDHRAAESHLRGTLRQFIEDNYGDNPANLDDFLEDIAAGFDPQFGRIGEEHLHLLLDEYWPQEPTHD